jgi:hypothetical protein
MGVKPCKDLAQGSLKALFGFLIVAHPWDHISCGKFLQEKGIQILGMLVQNISHQRRLSITKIPMHQDRLWSLFLQPLKRNFWQVPWFHIKSEPFKPRAFSTWESRMFLHTHSIYTVNPTCWRQKNISMTFFESNIILTNVLTRQDTPMHNGFGEEINSTSISWGGFSLHTPLDMPNIIL